MADNGGEDSLPKVIFLGKKQPRYDLEKLPKRSRRSSSFHRRAGEPSYTEQDTTNFGLTSSQLLGESLASVSQHPSDFDHGAESPGSSSSFITSEIDLLQAYKLEVIRAKAFTVLDATYTSAAIQDFDIRVSLLKGSSFQLTQRYHKKFLNKECWVYCCSCDVRRKEFICALSGEISQNYEDFEKSCQWPQCIHCDVVTFFMNELDVLNNLEPNTIALEEYTSGSGVALMDHAYACSGGVYDLQSSCSIVCVDPGDKNYGFVGRDQNRFKCLSCRYDTHSCSHVKYLQDQLDIDTGMLPEVVYNMISQSEGTSAVYHGPLVQSQKKIPFKVAPEIQNILKHGLSALPEVEQCSESGNLFNLIPNVQGNCDQCGEEWDKSDPVQCNWYQDTVVAISMNKAFNCKVFYRKCSDTDCCSIKSFDGKEVGCLYIGKRLVCYKVLRDYMHLFLYSGVTLHTFYKVWYDRHLDTGNTSFKKQIDYNSWRFAWYAFLRLLDVDYSSGWTCPVCGTQPDIIICDGTSLAFQKSFVPWQNLRQTSTTTSSDGASWPRESSHKDRVMIPHKEARELLKLYAQLKYMTDTSTFRMFTLLETNCPSVLRFVEWLEDHYISRHDAPKKVLSLLVALSCNSPVCALIHPDHQLGTVLEELAAKVVTLRQDPTKMHVVQTKCPVLFNAIVAMQLEELPVSWCTLIRSMIQKARCPFTDITAQVGQTIPSEESSSAVALNPNAETDQPNYAFFPNLPVKRQRISFPADRRKETEQNCSKVSRGHPSLLPGIFTIFCPHGICHGFQVMENHESPNFPFTIIWTRFGRAPSCIVYDNACNLHKYSLSRDPNFFQKTWFLVDRLHWKNHRGCSEGYRLSAYPEMDFLNSQINEQRNASLKRLKHQLSYMNPEHFMNHVKFYLWNINRKVQENMTSSSSAVHRLPDQ